MMGKLAMAWLLSTALLACGGGATVVKQQSEVPPADPRAAEKYLQASKLLAVAGKPAREERAMALLEASLRLDPFLWEAHYNLGVLQRRRGELRQALSHFQAAHRIQAAAPEPLAALAEVQHRLGAPQEAADLLEAYLRQWPDEVDVRVARTAVLREQQRFDAALVEARAALVRAPDHIGALMEVGRIYRGKEELEVAELVFKKALALDEKSPRPHNELGLTALFRGDTQLAFDHFQRALQADAKFAPARLNRASVLLNAGDYSAAEAEYRMVLRDDDGLSEARVGLGVSLRGQGKHQAARAEYEKVLQASPHHPAALFDLAILRAEFLDQRPQSRELFERFVAVAAEGPARTAAERYLQEIPAPAVATPRPAKRKPVAAEAAGGDS